MNALTAKLSRLCKGSWFLPALVALLTLWAFAPGLDAGFVDLDDANLLVHNIHFRGLGFENLRWMFAGSFNIGVYMPLSWLTLALDYLLWGMRPLGFHLTNLLLHAGGAVLCYFLMARLFRLARAAREDRDEPVWDAAAAFAALLFAVHPLRVESVAWVVERRDVLSGVFFFLTLLAYLRYCAGQTPDARRRWYLLSLSAYVLLLLSKAIGMTMPVLLLLLDAYPLRRLDGNAPRGVWLEKVPFLLLGVAFALMAGYAQKLSGAAWLIRDMGVPQRLAVMFYGLVFYLRKTLWPLHLYPLHELPAVVRYGAMPFAVSAAVVIAASLLIFWQRRRWPAAAVAWAAYLTILLPVSGLFQSGPLIVAEHAGYLACLGWPALAGAAFALAWLRLRPLRSVRRFQGLLGAAAAVIVFILAGLTRAQCRAWQDSETLYRHTIQEAPGSFIARTQLGNLLMARGEFAPGAEFLGQAYRIKPTVTAAYNLANALEKAGRWPEAVQFYLEVLRMDPGYLAAYNNLGTLLLRAGRPQEAARCLQEGLRHSDSAELHYNLGLVYRAGNKLNDGAAEFSRASEIRPGFLEARAALGAARLSQRRFAEAADCFRQVLQTRPEDADVHNNLGVALASLGRYDEAREHFARAASLNPALQSARDNLRKIAAQN